MRAGPFIDVQPADGSPVPAFDTNEVDCEARLFQSGYLTPADCFEYDNYEPAYLLG